MFYLSTFFFLRYLLWYRCLSGGSHDWGQKEPRRRRAFGYRHFSRVSAYDWTELRIFFFFVNVFASSTVRLHMHLHAEESQSTDQKRYPGFAF